MQLRDVAAGTPVGYGFDWRAPKRSRIATVSVGYADGWPRSLSNHGVALFEGIELPMVGKVSMDIAFCGSGTAAS